MSFGGSLAKADVWGTINHINFRSHLVYRVVL